MRKISQSAFILLILFGSCYRPSQPQAFEDMKVLEGDWASEEGTKFNESWKVVNDSLMEGIGYTMNNGDTVFSEKLKIIRTGNFVLYAAKPNEKKGFVYFRLEEAGKGRWTFSNPVHDYPNVIDYRLKDHATLVTRVTNTRGNKVIEFNLKRVDK